MTLEAIAFAGGVESGELIAVDDALERLEQQDSRTAEIVKLRIFAGLTISEVAEVLKIGRRTVDRQWAFARVWLLTQLNSEDSTPDN